MTTTPDPEMTKGLDKQFKYAILNDSRSRYDYGRYIVLDKPAFDVLKRQPGHSRQSGQLIAITPGRRGGYALFLPNGDCPSFLDRRLWAGLYCFDTQMGEMRELKDEQNHRFLSFNRSTSQWQPHKQLVPTISEAHPCYAYPWAIHNSLTYITFRSKIADDAGPRVLLNAALRGQTLLKTGEGGAKLGHCNGKAYCNGKVVKDCKTPEHYGLDDSRLYDGSRFLELQTGLVVPLARWAIGSKEEQPRFHSYHDGTWQSRVAKYPNAGSRKAGASATGTTVSGPLARGPSNATRQAAPQRPSAMRTRFGSNPNGGQVPTRKTVSWNDPLQLLKPSRY